MGMISRLLQLLSVCARAGKQDYDRNHNSSRKDVDADLLHSSSPGPLSEHQLRGVMYIINRCNCPLLNIKPYHPSQYGALWSFGQFPLTSCTVLYRLEE